jgi:hypothetical protein
MAPRILTILHWNMRHCQSPPGVSSETYPECVLKNRCFPGSKPASYISCHRDPKTIRPGFAQLSCTNLLHSPEIPGIVKEKTFVLPGIKFQQTTMIQKTRFFICGAVILVLIACIVSTGCTSTQSAQTNVRGNVPATIPSSQSTNPATAPGTIVTHPALKTPPSAPLSVMGNQMNSV